MLVSRSALASAARHNLSPVLLAWRGNTISVAALNLRSRVAPAEMMLVAACAARPCFTPIDIVTGVEHAVAIGALCLGEGIRVSSARLHSAF
jgi:hypothetical protein